MTSSLDAIRAVARQSPCRIVLSEGEDPRIIEGAMRAARDGLARPVLIGRESVIAERVKTIGAEGDAPEIVDPVRHGKLDAYAAAYHALRRHRGVDAAAAREAMADPLVLAAMMVREGDASGTIGGAVNTTSATVRAALQVIGRAPGVETVSSFFLMLLDRPHHPRRETVVFADCGLIVEPSVAELAQIAASSADSFHALTGETPRIAMLSFSTGGSARHKRVSHVAEATARLRTARPDLTVDGDIQFDAAFVPEVAATKAPGSPLAGRANVFVFPSLDAGNIGYKIAQRIGGATAIGPILQGLARPANDLSRGCSAEDVYDMLAVTGAQASAEAGPRP